MAERKFSAVAVSETNAGWGILTARKEPLYQRENDIRNEFERDYTRVLHCTAYRRLKHKTQVFCNIDNDHVCTRMEHVCHVESVSSTIAKELGLNGDLVKAISIAHDLGHAPFGHQGERILSEITQKYLGETFWHEKNGLHFVDDIELLEGDDSKLKPLDLTYAVRDGIISHCGEVDLNGLRPRDIRIGPEAFQTSGDYEAATWEGCVVKMADKISYVGRDIEDAVTLGLLNEKDIEDLISMARDYDESVVNTTVIMNRMIRDICENSSPENGICLSEKANELLTEIKAFNYERIYGSKAMGPYIRYARLVLEEIFDALMELYQGADTWSALERKRLFCPTLISYFSSWIAGYCDIESVPEGEYRKRAENCINRKIYGSLETEELYTRAVIDFISGMTDRYAVSVYNELLHFGIQV